MCDVYLIDEIRQYFFIGNVKTSCSPRHAEGSTGEVELPGLEGEEHGTAVGEPLTPLGQRQAGKNQGVLTGARERESPVKEWVPHVHFS